MAKKIVVDAGHGGSDPGTINNGITEKDYTLKISEYMNKRFNDLGISSSMSRTGDETLTQSTRPSRVQSFYGSGSDVIVISNHINAGGGDGAEIIYSLRNNDTLSKKIATELEREGQNIRKYYQRRLPSNPSKDYYYLLRDTPNNETIIVEYGFADSSGDDVSLLKNNWKNLAEAVVRGVANYAGVPYSAPSDSNINYYIVKSGDSLWSIAKKYGLSVDELKNANNKSGTLLVVGETLIIPNKSTTPSSNNTYTVKSGDTLYAIANKYNTTVDNLKSLNGLTSNLLQIGQVLNIPSSTNTYIVKSGDTLYSIAKRYNTTVDRIKSLNGLTSNLLQIGQVLKI